MHEESECDHDNWYTDEAADGRPIRICEDCDDWIYESDVVKRERMEPCPTHR